MIRIAYLNCEVKSRDLSTRLLIASHLLEFGVPVVVGQVWALVANAKAGINHPGVYLFATTNQYQAKAMTWVKKAGHRIIASDEEMLPGREPVLLISPTAMEICDQFLIDTAEHEQAISAAFPEAKHKFSVSGPVRLETLLKMKFDPAPPPAYILFNTGSGVANSIRGEPSKAIEVLRNATGISQEQAELIAKAGQISIEWMTSLISWLAPNQRVVVRPHPAERVETWRKALPPNVEIVERSDPIRWIKGARIVVHNNSTTGLEAAALGIPTLNLNPIPPLAKRYILPEINHTVSTLSEARNTLEEFLTKGVGPIIERAKAGLAFPKDGALNTAKAIFAMLKGAPAITDNFPWAKMERAQMDREKFTVSFEELTKVMRSLSIECHVHTLDDSVFLLTPKNKPSSK